jgi:hypothetical protein
MNPRGWQYERRGCTRRRSRKVREITSSPHGEVAWYFPETREQYRLQCLLTVVDEGATATHLVEVRSQQAAPVVRAQSRLLSDKSDRKFHS